MQQKGREKIMFLRNTWYVAAMSHEVERTLLPRTLLGEAVVMYRQEDGTPVALEDRCAHRRAPLSLGRLDGDTVECGYHGLAFDRTGACVRIPGQAKLPPGAGVRSYPLVERWGWCWIWMGDAAKADPELIPDIHWNDSPDWAVVHDLKPLKAHHQLLVDNLMDLSHLTFTHGQTIGTSDNSTTPITTERGENTVSVTRYMRDTNVPPMIKKAANLPERIDRWQKIHFLPPSTVLIDVGMVPVGADESESESGAGVQMWVLNLITPETESSTHYFWGHARNYAHNDKDVQDLVYREVDHTFNEDVEIIEGQQRVIEANPAAPTLDINHDAGMMQVRRLMDRLIAQEAA